MFWCQLDAKAWHEIGERIMRLGQMLVHRIHHLLRRMRARDGEHAGVNAANQVLRLII